MGGVGKCRRASRQGSRLVTFREGVQAAFVVISPPLPLHVHMLFCTFLTRSSKEALSPQGSSYPSCALLRNELLLSSMIYKLLHTPPKKDLSLILQL